jgi:hypothetical protein
MRNPIAMLRERLWPARQAAGDWYRPESVRHAAWDDPDFYKQTERWIKLRSGWMIGAGRRKTYEGDDF